MESLCACGCGAVAPIAAQTKKSRGWIKGRSFPSNANIGDVVLV